jgi:integrase
MTFFDTFLFATIRSFQMASNKNTIKTLADVITLVEGTHLARYQRRDMRSAINRIAEMAGVAPMMGEATAPSLRQMLKDLRPAAHGVTPKTWANILSQFRAALRLAGVIDPRGEGGGLRNAAWVPLLEAIAEDKRLSCGLVAFANYCAARAITPPRVDDAVVQQFHVWLEERTLCPKPKDVVRRVPYLWNEASERIGFWPKTKLSIVSFRPPQKRLRWADLAESFRADVEAYLAMRADPDIFDERPNAPKKPLAMSTLQQQREHLRLAASVLVESGIPVEEVTSLTDLVQPERFKTILRHYHDRADRLPNAFATLIAQTLLQVGRHHLPLTEEKLSHLKRIAAKLPAIPADLTPKNKAVLRHFESDALKSKLLFLPDALQAEVVKALEGDRVLFVEAQMALAIDIQLAIALRPQNLSALNWRHHFLEPDGPRGRLVLLIPAAEMKSRKDDFGAEIPSEVARRLRWYRRTILPHLGADPNGELFVTGRGTRKDQRTLTIQMLKTVKRHLGVHMTAHQFRHLLGSSYLDANPHDTETVRLLLGHGWTKTTRIYVGSQSRRASRAYNEFLFEQRERLKLRRTRQARRKPKANTTQDNRTVKKQQGEPACAD